MAHSHSHAPADYGRAFAVGVALNLGFVVVELIYGFLSDSLALIADAGHNASDVLGLLIAWAAFALSKRRPSARYTYGLRRSSILASLTNAALLLVAVGIAVNALTAALFAPGRGRDLNVRGAFQHMAADALVSLGVVIASALILLTGWAWLDPAISLLVGVVILASTWGLLRDSLNLALDAVPAGVDLGRVRGYLEALPGVSGVHDLHVWAISTTETALTAHLVMPGGVPDSAFYGRVQGELHHQFEIVHATLQVEQMQVERGEHACDLAGDEVV